MNRKIKVTTAAAFIGMTTAAQFSKSPISFGLWRRIWDRTWSVTE